MREEKFHIYLNDDEYSRLIQSLIRLKNSLTAQGRCTDAVDDILYLCFCFSYAARASRRSKARMDSFFSSPVSRYS